MGDDDPGTSRSMGPPETSSKRGGISRLLRVGKATAALVVLAVAAYIVARVLPAGPVTMAVVVALLVTAPIGPLVGRLRQRLPGSVAALSAYFC